MDRKQKNLLRMKIMNKYNAGKMTEEELGEQLGEVVKKYKEANEIDGKADRIHAKKNVHIEEYVVDEVIPPEKYLDEYKRLKKAGVSNEGIARRFHISASALRSRRKTWVEQGVLEEQSKESKHIKIARTKLKEYKKLRALNKSDKFISEIFRAGQSTLTKAKRIWEEQGEDFN